MVLIAAFMIVTTGLTSKVFLMDEELPPERFQMVGDRLYIYSVNLLRKLNTDFQWDNIKKSLEVEWNGNFITFNNNSTKVALNGETVYLSTSPRIINNRFFLPLLETCRLLGLRMVTKGDDYYIYSSEARLEKYYWLPGGITFIFDKPISLSIRRQDSQTMLFDVIGAKIGEEIASSNKITGISEFQAYNYLEDTMKSFLRFEMTIDEKQHIEPFVEDNVIYLLSEAGDGIPEVEEDKTKVVVIDPGHGGFDPGAMTDDGFQEKNGVLSVSKFLKNKLEEKGYQVFLTRNRDNFVDLMERSRYANQKKADLFVSLHMNYVEADYVEGVELFYYKWSEPSYINRLNRYYTNPPLTQGEIQVKIGNKIDSTFESEELAGTVASSFEESGFTINKTIPEDFAVVAYSEMPSLLIECGFLSNKTFRKNIKRAGFQEKISTAIAEGIDDFLKE